MSQGFQQTKHQEVLSPEEAHLEASLKKAFHDIERIQSKRDQLGAKLDGDSNNRLQMYLTVARNSLTETQRFLGAGNHPKAQRKFDLAENELRRAEGIISSHQSEMTP